MAEIILEQVNKRFEEKQVLDSFSFSVSQTGIYALSGASGCGKTTLLRLIAGLEHPDSGKIQIQGSLTYLFQENRLLPWFSVKENLLAVRPEMTPSQLEELLELVELQREEDSLPSTLSGGMQRRVALIRALAHDGEILLLDEPFQGLDVDSRERIASRLLPLLQKKLCLLITHDPWEAEHLADHRILLSGPPLSIIN